MPPGLTVRGARWSTVMGVDHMGLRCVDDGWNRRGNFDNMLMRRMTIMMRHLGNDKSVWIGRDG